MKRLLLIPLVVLVAAPALAGERWTGDYRWRSFQALGDAAGAIPGPCTRSQQQECDFSCMNEKEPHELLRDAECHITAPTDPNAFECTCHVIELVPEGTGGTPQPNPVAGE